MDGISAAPGMRERGCVRVAQMSMALHLIRESFGGYRTAGERLAASPPQCSINSPLTFRHSVAEISRRCV